MLISCVRCGSPAAVTMSYDYEAKAVFLDDLVDHDPGAGYPLCAPHADRLTPPIGWNLTDRRTGIRLFVPLEVA